MPSARLALSAVRFALLPARLPPRSGGQRQSAPDCLPAAAASSARPRGAKRGARAKRRVLERRAARRLGKQQAARAVSGGNLEITVGPIAQCLNLTQHSRFVVRRCGGRAAVASCRNRLGGGAWRPWRGTGRAVAAGRRRTGVRLALLAETGRAGRARRPSSPGAGDSSSASRATCDSRGRFAVSP